MAGLAPLGGTLYRAPPGASKGSKYTYNLWRTSLEFHLRMRR